MRHQQSSEKAAGRDNRCKGNDDELDIYITKDFHDKRILIVRTFLWVSIKIDR